VTLLYFYATVSVWEIQQEFAGTSWGWNSGAVRRPSYCARAYIKRKLPAALALIDNPSVAGRSSSRKADCGR